MEPTSKQLTLVCDDARTVRESLGRALEFHDYAVSFVADGADALAAIAGNAPDALVLDVLMLTVDGLQTTRALGRA